MTALGDIEARVERTRQYDGFNGWTYHSRVSVEHQYVCMTVPKVACTTVKRTLHEFERLPPADHWGEVHGQGTELTLSGFATPAIVEMLVSPDWLRFCFVRDPYDRLLSAWKSKIGNSWDNDFVRLRKRIRAAYRYPSRGDGEQAIIPFRDFVHFVAESDDPFVVQNPHWDLQTGIVLHELITYDVVVRFESFAQDFPAVLRRLGAPGNVMAIAAEFTNSTRRVPLAAAYDRELADLVYRMYEPDFEAFSYDRDNWLFDGV